MNRILNSLSLALASAALLIACSRPVATFQPSKTERFYTQQTAAAPVAEPTAPVTASDNVPGAAPVVAESARAVVAQTQLASDALASLKATHATEKRLTKRIERAEKMLAEASEKVVAQPTTTKKAGLMQRLMTKSMDKKIQKHLAPQDTKAMSGSSYIRLGGIIALVGLLLLLIGNGVGATIGLIALIAGLVLLLLGIINQG